MNVDNKVYLWLCNIYMTSCKKVCLYIPHFFFNTKHKLNNEHH